MVSLWDKEGFIKPKYSSGKHRKTKKNILLYYLSSICFQAIVDIFLPAILKTVLHSISFLTLYCPPTEAKVEKDSIYLNVFSCFFATTAKKYDKTSKNKMKPFSIPPWHNVCYGNKNKLCLENFINED